jgi:hypothetical protein
MIAAASNGLMAADEHRGNVAKSAWTDFAMFELRSLGCDHRDARRNVLSCPVPDDAEPRGGEAQSSSFYHAGLTPCETLRYGGWRRRFEAGTVNRSELPDLLAIE